MSVWSEVPYSRLKIEWEDIGVIVTCRCGEKIALGSDGEAVTCEKCGRQFGLKVVVEESFEPGDSF